MTRILLTVSGWGRDPTHNPEYSRPGLRPLLAEAAEIALLQPRAFYNRKAHPDHIR